MAVLNKLLKTLKVTLTFAFFFLTKSFYVCIILFELREGGGKREGEGMREFPFPYRKKKKLFTISYFTEGQQLSSIGDIENEKNIFSQKVCLSGK